MRNKDLMLLAVILGILIIFWGLKIYFLPRFFVRPSSYIARIKSYNKDSVQSIVIKNTSVSLELQKQGEIWKVNNKKADISRVNALLNQLFPLKPPEVIAQTDKRHKEFNLTEETATSVSLDGKLTWLVGKSAGMFVYSRFKDDNTVYLLKVNSLVDFSTDASSWHDKNILIFDQTKATKLTFEQKRKSATFSKEEDKWVNKAEAKEVEKEKINSLLSQISNLLAQSLYLPNAKTKYVITPLVNLTVEYEGGNETLEFSKANSDYLVKRASDGEEFIVGEHSISSIISLLNEIF